MPNRIDEGIREKLAAIGAEIISPDGKNWTAKFKDPQKQQQWKAYSKAVQSADESRTALFPDGRAEARNEYLAQENDNIELERRRALARNEATLGQVPILQAREDINNESYERKNKDWTNNQLALVNAGTSLERGLDSSMSDRHRAEIDYRNSYDDKYFALAKQEMDQQRANGIVNLIGRLALGGLALMG